MGSYDAAIMTGFICRLCSELNSNVVHIYSEKGIKLQLAEKINLMPISVEPQDSLPKTICYSCVHQLDNQYRLIQQLRNSRDKILTHARMHVRLHQERERNNSQNCSNSNSNQNSSETSQSSSESPQNNSEQPDNVQQSVAVCVQLNSETNSQNNEQINTDRYLHIEGANEVVRAQESVVSDTNNNASP